jgi:cytochrome c556
MIRLLSGAVLLAVMAASAAAEPRHDVRLEQAAMKIVAQKVGDIRGGFSHEEKPVFIRTAASALDNSTTDPIETGTVTAAKIYSDRRVMTPDDITALRQRRVSRVIVF